MKQRIKFFLFYGLFWLIFFVFARLLFLTYHYNQTATLNFEDIILTVIHGFRLDLSTMGYFMLLPGLLFVAFSFFNGDWLAKVLNIYTAILLIISAFLVVVDLELYAHWGFRLDTTPLMYVDKEAAGSGDTIQTVFLVILFLIIFLSFGWGYLKFYSQGLKKAHKSNWKTAFLLLLLTGCLIAPIRGTLGVAPINTGTVYFHESNLFANHAAVNVVYNAGYALTKLDKLKYPSNFLEADKTELYFKKLYNQEGDTKYLLNTDKPNVIVIVLESYTFKFIEPLGGKAGIAPNFNRLTKEGILFDNFYSSGDRTDKGIVSVLSGYPTQPVTSIIKFPKKTQSLPFLSNDLNKIGYTSSFTYGGNIDFANFRSYLSTAQFQSITSDEDFPSNLNNSKWGVHDEFVFDKFFEEIKNTEMPFFKMMLSLSSHEPYTVPMETKIEGDDNESKFLNAAYYTDIQLGEFIRKAKKTDWWKNTWVVITADHGHTMPDNWGIDNPDRFKIPMLWLGGALSVQDTVVHSFANQTDIANTILSQLGAYNPEFKFSNNIFSSEYDDFAMFVFNNGYGYLDGEKTVIYDNTSNRYLTKEGVKQEQDLYFSKAYMQTLYNDFNQR